MRNSTFTMEPNNLNIPPSEEPFGKKLSRVASQFVIPILMPVSSVFIGWLNQRRISIQLTQLRKEKEHITDLKEDIVSIEAEVDGLKQQRDLLTFQENQGVEAIRRRQVLEKAILKEEEKAEQKILTDLEALRPLLQRRQDIYCNLFVHRSHRLRVESELLSMAYFQSYDKDLALYIGMQDILSNDKSCGGQRNGCLMWVYLDFWKTKAELLKYKRVANRMKTIDESFTQ